jgi:hypothetical protein
LVVLGFTPVRLPLSAYRRFWGLLSLGVLSHLGFTISIVWWLGRPPFFTHTELVSLFGLGCASISLIGAQWLRSRFVVAWGVGCALFVTVWLLVPRSSQAIPDLVALHRFVIWWYGCATALGFAAGCLAFAAQLRALLSRMQLKWHSEFHVDSVDEGSMSSLSLALVRLGYPLILSGLLSFFLGSLEAVCRGWFWQRTAAAQLFALAAYTIYLHLAATDTGLRAKTFLAQTMGFCGLIVSVLSFSIPEGLLRGLGLGLFL